MAIVETMSEKLSEICIINEICIDGDCFFWPPKSKRHLPQYKFLKLVPESNWTRIEEFHILKRGISNDKIIEVFFSRFSNFN